jgi:hypothetical protein
MEQSKIRKELDAFMKQQKELGAKRRDIALVLFARGYTEKNVGLVMSIDPRSAAAMKVDFSKKGKESIEKKGKRIHLDPAKANLKRVAGKKVITRFIELCDKVLAESDKAKG